MADAQRVALAAADHRGHALARVEADATRPLRRVVGAQHRGAAQRLSVELQARIAVGHEADARRPEVDHAELARPHVQADAVVAVAADVVRAGFDPVQADQRGPAIGRQQFLPALRAPCGLVALEGRPRGTLGGARRLRRGWFARAGDGRRQRDAEHQRPRRNHRSISARSKRAQVGRP
jgi:hypothetical protein